MKLRFSKRTAIHDVLVFDDNVVNVVELDNGLLVGTVTFTDPSLIEAFRSALDFLSEPDASASSPKKTSPPKSSTKAKARKTTSNA